MKFDKILILTIILSGLGILGCAAAVTSSTVTSTVAANAPDQTKLPIGDGKVGSSAKVGWVFSCQTRFPPAGGAFKDGPWIKSDGTFDFTAKAIVDGNVTWTSSQTFTLEGATNTVTGNGLPKHTTGTYPVSSSDDAYQYDRNPNPIKTQTINYSLPVNPAVTATPTCLGLGPIGITLTGAVFFNALDANGKDAVAHELQDACQGHPERSGQYHYHNLTSCLNDLGTGHSSLQGYVRDGFGLYGLRGEAGKMLTNAALDGCHGHTHQIVWNGKAVGLYHYHATYEYPYTIGCYKGKPVN